MRSQVSPGPSTEPAPRWHHERPRPITAQGRVRMKASGACVHATAPKRRSTLYRREGIWGCGEGGPDIYGAFTTSRAPGSTRIALLSLYDNCWGETARPFLLWGLPRVTRLGRAATLVSNICSAHLALPPVQAAGQREASEQPLQPCQSFCKKKKKGPDRMALANLPRAVLHEVKLGKSRCHSSLAVSTGSGRSCRSVPARRQMSFEQTGCAACLLWPRLRY